MDVRIFGLFEFLVQTKIQSVLALVTNGEVWEDEVAGLLGAIQVCDAGHRGAGENSHCILRLRHTALRDWSGMFQCREQEEIGIVGEGDILPVLAFIDMKFDDRRWIHWTPVCRCWVIVSHGVEILMGFSDIHLAPEPQALARSGCWMTSSSYSNSRPSLVMRLMLALVSLGTAMMLLGMLSDAGYWTRFLGSAS